MQKYIVFAVVLSIAAAPAIAQQKSSANDRAMEHAAAIEKMIVDNFNKKNAAGIAALYASNALFVGPDGKTYTGRAAVEADEADTIKAWGDFKFVGEVKEAHAVGNGIWALMSSAVDGNGPNGPVKVRSHVVNVIVPEGKGWKIVLTSIGANVPPPAAPAK
ncbi:MAG TPA: nuclear transport factor 2 family protein [Stellaceae bacterium]|nr:nuclear transport factor 2 family protein [Stellaceae bacterium]